MEEVAWVYVAIWPPERKMRVQIIAKSAVEDYRRGVMKTKGPLNISPHLFFLSDNPSLIQMFIERSLWEAMGGTVNES